MYLAAFLMVLIFCTAISLAGASIGVTLRNAIVPKHYVNRTWNQSAIALVATVFIANLAFQLSRKHDAQNEEVSVVNFVKRNIEVQSKAGVINTVSIHSIRSKKGSSTKEYDLYVIGDKTVFPVVRVSNESSPPQIVLACVSEVSGGQRDPFKDPCKQ